MALEDEGAEDVLLDGERLDHVDPGGDGLAGLFGGAALAEVADGVDVAGGVEYDVEFGVAGAKPFAKTGFEGLASAVSGHAAAVEAAAGIEVMGDGFDVLAGDGFAVLATVGEDELIAEDGDVGRMHGDGVVGLAGGGGEGVAGGGGEIVEAAELGAEGGELRAAGGDIEG